MLTPKGDNMTDTITEAWAAALADSSNLITSIARKRSLEGVTGRTDDASKAAKWLLLDGGAQQGLNPTPWAGRNRLATERWSECVSILNRALGTRWTADRATVFPNTREGWCRWYRQLDAEYGTIVRSPLHHDKRCPLHGTRPR